MEPITLILLYIFAALFVAVLPSFVRRAPLLSFAPVCPRCQGRGWAT